MNHKPMPLAKADGLRALLSAPAHGHAESPFLGRPWSERGCTCPVAQRSGAGPMPGASSPQLQEAGRATADGTAQLVQRVVERHIRELLRVPKGWMRGGWQKDGQV